MPPLVEKFSKCDNNNLEDVIKNWFGVIDDYIKYFGGNDVPYWYNERASISTLAAAAWKSGGIALEEYSMQKGDEGNPRPGKCDIFIGINKRHFAC